MNLDAENDVNSNLRIRFKTNASPEALAIKNRLKLELNLSSRYIYESVLVYLYSGLYKDTSKDYCKTNIISDDSLLFGFYCPSLKEGRKIIDFLRSIKRSEQRKLVMNALYYRVFILDKISFSLDSNITPNSVSSAHAVKEVLAQISNNDNEDGEFKDECKIIDKFDEDCSLVEPNKDSTKECNVELSVDELKNITPEPAVIKLDIPILF